jgi:hypothetical protein
MTRYLPTLGLLAGTAVFLLAASTYQRRIMAAPSYAAAPLAAPFVLMATGAGACFCAAAAAAADAQSKGRRL